MKVRLTMPVRDRGVLSAVALALVGVLLLAVTVSACSGSPPSSVHTPQPTVQAGSTPGQPGASGTPSASAGVTTARVPPSATRTTSQGQASPTSRPSTTVRPTPTGRQPSASPPSAVPSATRYPSGAPETGGGGTAGLQHGRLFAVGGVAILAGIASLAYRRRLTRGRSPRDRYKD